MKFGVFLPISGRAASAVLADAARQAEALGYDSVWAADRIVTPWEITTLYPYSADQRFIVPPDIPFLEPLSCLAFLAGRTETIALGMSVLVMPYRHPLYFHGPAVARADRADRTVCPRRGARAAGRSLRAMEARDVQLWPLGEGSRAVWEMPRRGMRVRSVREAEALTPSTPSASGRIE